jgi:hypothetical protein
MIRQASTWAGSKYAGGFGWTTVPYETAIDRVFDNEALRAAPIVPEESAKAAIHSGSVNLEEERR